MTELTKTQLTDSHIRELEDSARRLQKLGVAFAVCDCAGCVRLVRSSPVFESDEQEFQEVTRCVLAEYSQCEETGPIEPSARQSDSGHTILAVPLKVALYSESRQEAAGVALIDLGDQSQATQRSVFFAEILRLLAEKFAADHRAEEQIERFGVELSLVYEELVLLHKLSANMRVTESDASFLQLACDSLTDIMSVEGIAILVDKPRAGGRQLTLAAGSGVIDIDQTLASLLYSRLMDELGQGRESLLDSNAYSDFRYDWPGHMRSLVAVPLYGKDAGGSISPERQVTGLLVAVNRTDKPDFDSIDAKLFMSVAGSCAVFIQNGRLFCDLKELFVGSLKALTSSIDAKDPYTRGHSERVALISRWIAERLSATLSLDSDQIYRVYLAGLLHDIGKIGVDEGVLRKNGRLTDDERLCIKKHPSIGAGILRGIRQMRDIVPGVLSHHERVDGQGYPDGLTGDAIPLIGKIVGLADSFDAMTSKRSYRDAMVLESALEEIRRGIGTQFDEQVAQVFLDSDVHELWRIIQETTAGEAEGHFATYGSMAVGTLVR